MTCSTLTNEELIAALKRLVTREREAIADVVEHLAEVDARRLYIPAACSSLTTYCVEILGYSQFAAAHRVTAARLVREYPIALPMLRSGDLNLSTLRTLAPVLTASNHRERLEAAVGRTRNELERMVAGWAPKPDVPTRIVPMKVEERPVLLERMEAAATESRPAAPSDLSSMLTSSHAVASVPLPMSRPGPLPKPLTPERYSVQVTVDRETYEDLMRVRDHLRHAIPDGDVAKIVARAVKELRERVEARKFGKRKADRAKMVTVEPTTVEPTTVEPTTVEPITAEPETAEPETAEPETAEPIVAKPATAEPASDDRSSTSEVRHPSFDVRPPPSAARRPPAQAAQPELFASPIIDEGETMSRAPGRATRREVAERDHYRCRYVSDDGHRCSSTAWLEYDHKLEWASNGPTWPENMQLLCWSHNQAKEKLSPSPSVRDSGSGTTP